MKKKKKPQDGWFNLTVNSKNKFQFAGKNPFGQCFWALNTDANKTIKLINLSPFWHCEFSVFQLEN